MTISSAIPAEQAELMHDREQMLRDREYSEENDTNELDKLVKILRDPDAFFEAVGPDGITYPFDDNFYQKTEKQRETIRAQINDYHTVMVNQMVNAIHAAAEADKPTLQKIADAALGKVFREQALAHAKRILQTEMS